MHRMDAQVCARIHGGEYARVYAHVMCAHVYTWVHECSYVVSYNVRVCMHITYKGAYVKVYACVCMCKKMNICVAFAGEQLCLHWAYMHINKSVYKIQSHIHTSDS